MQNSNRTIHYAFATFVTLVALVTYLMTVQPTVPFWDCGEFTAAAVQQQVPHPPGAPLFLMLGKIFHLLPFGDPGWRVNLLSVMASAATVLLLYLITVRVIRNFFREDLNQVGNALVVYGGGLVAALTYTFTDTFWFNAVESEVYAASSLFVAIIVHLMMIWNEKADEPGHERYLLFIVYLIGLSIGVHLLSILTVFSIVLLVFLRKYTFSVPKLLLTMGIGVALFFVIYNLIIMKLPALFAGNFPFKNDAREFLVEDNIFFVMVGIGLIIGAGVALFYSRKSNNGIVSLVASSFLLLILGYSTYAHILVRANSNPPMNENKPSNFSKLVSYLGREQYGEAPTWPRRYQQEQRFVNNYLEYGPWTEAPVKRVTRKDGMMFGKPDFSKWKTDGKSRFNSAEFAYLWDYQINKMYIRYFLWNFMGRVSDVQDASAMSPLTNASVVEQTNYKNGYSSHFPINYYALPLLLGLIGLVFHFVRDRNMAWVYLVLFLMTGVLAAIQQNQQNPQPRERDYFYVSSFMVFAMWVGLGAFVLMERLKNNAAAVGGTLAGLIMLVPVNMATKNWFTHSRAGNYLAFDYAYNILQSVEKDAILFTNGDNDTFPVWYLQDVAGIRRDVRVVNLSLGQTTWYIEQLKNREPWGAKKLPLSFDDSQLLVDEEDAGALSYDFGPAQVVTVPVSKSVLSKWTTDQSIIDRGQFTWTFTGSPRGRGEDGKDSYFYGVQHKLVADIIKQTKFERPVYFSTSMGVEPGYADEHCGLQDYMRLEGLAFRVCPVAQVSAVGYGVDDNLMRKYFMVDLPEDEVHSEPHVGLKFRNLNNMDVYYDDVHRGYISSYRYTFFSYARYKLYEQRDSVGAGKVLDRMNQLISTKQFPISMMFEMEIGRLYNSVENYTQAEAIGLDVLKTCDMIIKNPNLYTLEQGFQVQPGSTDEEALAQVAVSARILASEGAKLAGKWDLARRYLNDVSKLAGRPQEALYRIDELVVYEMLRKRDYNGALTAALALRDKYGSVASDIQQIILGLQLRTGRSAEQFSMAVKP